MAELKAKLRTDLTAAMKGRQTTVVATLRMALAAVTTEAFLITRSYLALPVALAVHVVGYFACLREPRIFDLWITKVSRCPRTRNWKRWGCNSYAP